MKELFKGNLNLSLFTVVESLESKRDTKNQAHEGLSSDFLDELKTLVQAQGYYVQVIAADLNSTGEAAMQQEKIITEAVKFAMPKADYIRGKTKRTRIEI